tara:strand:+ start:120 stop:3326 length:3207 start_codon:yes stop_codon:yes gene_type:complete
MRAAKEPMDSEYESARPACRTYRCCLCTRCCCLFFTILLIFMSQLLVDIMKLTIRDWTVIDSSQKLKEMSERTHEVVTFNFFNLTNGYALQTEWPPPKPRFEVVPVKFNYTLELINGSIIDDGLGYKFVQWSYYDVVDESDGDLEIVQVNPIYLGAIPLFGAPSESTLFAGLSTTALGMVNSMVFAAGVDQLFSPLVALQGVPTIAQTVTGGLASVGLSSLEIARNWADNTNNPFNARTIDLGANLTFAIDSQPSLPDYLTAYVAGVGSLPSSVQQSAEMQALLGAAQMLHTAVASDWAMDPLVVTETEALSLFIAPSGTCDICNATSHECCSILAPAGGAAWFALGSCLGAAASTAEQGACLEQQPGIVALFVVAGTDAAAIPAKMGGVVGWMSRFGGSQGALRTSMHGLASMFGHGDLGIWTDLSSLTDLKYLQFGAGLLTQAALQSATATSLADYQLFRQQGVCTPVEIYSYLNHAQGPLASGGALHQAALALAAAAGISSTATISLSFSMTIAQAKAFLDTMTVSADIVFLAGAFGATLASDPTCASAECAAARAALTTDGETITATYGTLVIMADSAPAITLCDTASGTGLLSDVSPLSGGQCALLALAYADYLVSHLGPRFLMGCQLVGGPTANDPLSTGGFTLRPDGTGAANSGLFTRRTVRQLWFGWDDPLLQLAEGATYDGLAGIDIPEPADLLAKFADGSEVPSDWTYSFASGKGVLADRGTLLRHPDERPMGSPDYPGYRLSDGKLGGGDYDPEGLRKVEEQEMLEDWPTPMEAMEVGMMTSPAEAITSGSITLGEPVSAYMADMRRDVVFKCEDGCPWVKIHDKVYVKAYVASNTSQEYQLSKGGVTSVDCSGTVSQQHYDASIALGMPPAGSPSTCDYGMRFPFVFDTSQAYGFPSAVTLAYFGHSDASVRDAVSMVNATTGEDLVYDLETNGPGLWFEPFSGWLVKGNERFQNNFIVERTMLDSPMYANIFGRSDDNNDVFVWPYMYANREAGLTPEQAADFEMALYGGYTAAKAILLIGILLTCVLAVTFFFEVKELLGTFIRSKRSVYPVKD